MKCNVNCYPFMPVSICYVLLHLFTETFCKTSLYLHLALIPAILFQCVEKFCILLI